MFPKRLNTFLLTAKTLCQIKTKKTNWFSCHFSCSCDARVYKFYTHTHTHTHTHTRTYIYTYIYITVSNTRRRINFGHVIKQSSFCLMCREACSCLVRAGWQRLLSQGCNSTEDSFDWLNVVGSCGLIGGARPSWCSRHCGQQTARNMLWHRGLSRHLAPHDN